MHDKIGGQLKKTVTVDTVAQSSFGDRKDNVFVITLQRGSVCVQYCAYALLINESFMFANIV